MKSINCPKPNAVNHSASYRPANHCWGNRRENSRSTAQGELPSTDRRLGGGGNNIPKPTRPVSRRINSPVAPIMRPAQTGRIRALDEIAKLAGERPEHWTKPRFGEFEYWLAHNCGWISDEELNTDTTAFQTRQKRALVTSHRFRMQRFSWEEGAHLEEPRETGEYVPEVNMKLVKDRNLTDSARRIAMFILRHTYQDNRAGRFIGMTVSFIMKGLSLSRRTVQRSLTLLETRGYFRCDVAKGETTRMCIGLIIHLLSPLFPKHHKENWPARRGNPEASKMPQKQEHFYNSIYQAKHKVSRMNWAIRCMDGVFRAASRIGLAYNDVTGGCKHRRCDSSVSPIVGSTESCLGQ